MLTFPVCLKRVLAWVTELTAAIWKHEEKIYIHAYFYMRKDNFYVFETIDYCHIFWHLTTEHIHK